MIEQEPLDPEILPPQADDDGSARRAALGRLEALEHSLDRQFSIGGLRLGWDGLLGLVPGIGDTVTAALAGWIIYEAHRLGAPNHLKMRMAANAGLDYVLGLVPLVGDLADFAFKANTRNVRLLRQHLAEQERRAGR